MRFKTDENIHPDAADFLRSLGHDVLTVWDQKMRGARDERIAQVCRAENRSLITFDLDFADIRTYPPQDYAGFLVLRIRSQGRKHLLDALRRTIPLFDELTLSGRLWIFDDMGVRVHGESEP